jgi:hypothetical protein
MTNHLSNIKTHSNKGGERKGGICMVVGCVFVGCVGGYFLYGAWDIKNVNVEILRRYVLTYNPSLKVFAIPLQWRSIVPEHPHTLEAIGTSALVFVSPQFPASTPFLPTNKRRARATGITTIKRFAGVGNIFSTCREGGFVSKVINGGRENVC